MPSAPRVLDVGLDGENAVVLLKRRYQGWEAIKQYIVFVTFGQTTHSYTLAASSGVSVDDDPNKVGHAGR